MNGKKTWLVLIIGMLVATVAGAQSSDSDRFSFDPGSALFGPNEVSLDLGGYYGTHDRHGGNASWGPAIGVNYFFTDHFGAGADSYVDWFTEPYLINFSALARLPIGSTGLAPYALAGFGRQWKYVAQWTGHIGIGLEYRFNPLTAVFTELREVFPDQSRDTTVVRFGFRLAF